ncbi:MAG: MarR family transcriptional regulator [Clostridia bacterium]|nr:MarR family transcriptional regulator [Clostridia bacterium]
MLEDSFANIYTKFKHGLYAKVFNQDIAVEDSLSSTEVLCAELISSMDNPTINEFASFAGVSTPNATYKINRLVAKGYVEKIQSETDKREFHLRITDKYKKTYGETYDYIGTVMKRIRQRFTEEEVKELESMLGVINSELMPEMKDDEFEEDGAKKQAEK